MDIIDTHLHLTDLRIWGKRLEIMEIMKNKSITCFLNAGYCKEEWLRQIELKSINSNFKMAWGLHPYWIDAQKHSTEALHLEFDFLKNNIDKIDAIGETGLDLRSQFSESENLQEEYFKKHIELHLSSKKPMILHFVRNLGRGIKILKNKNKEYSGIIHSFSGSWEEAQCLIKLGFYISISTGICNTNAKRIRKVAKEISLEHLLIETDSPDQAPPDCNEKYNMPWNVVEVARTIGALRGEKADNIIQRSNENFLSIFS
ncbi:MAG: TatD family hydrolase [Bdellovibrionota bacterium]|nr:TatD family hydrolase [Bdellovibrionota bacterium]